MILLKQQMFGDEGVVRLSGGGVGPSAEGDGGERDDRIAEPAG